MNLDKYKPQNTELIIKNNVFGINTLYIKDESKNLTHTFKDRLAYEMLQPIIDKINKGEKITKTTFCSISYGNTAYSMGYYCNLLNEMYGSEIVNAVAIVPPNLSSKIYGPDTDGNKEKASDIFKRIEKYCSIIELDLEKQYYTSDDLEKVIRDNNLCFDNFVNITEGLDRPAYDNIIAEVIERQLKTVPDYIIVPFGAGILCNEILDYVNDHKLKTKVIPVSSGNPDTIAIMLYGPIWVNVKELEEKGKAMSYHKGYDLKGRKREPYLVYNIKDEDILNILEPLSKIGISSEPSAAAGFAFINKLKDIDNNFNPEKHSVLVINTGNSFLNNENKKNSNYKSQIEFTPELENYIIKSNSNSNFDLEALRNKHSSIDDQILQITSSQAYFLSFIQKMQKTNLALDIGTYKGYSALITALSTGDNSRIISCEIDRNLGEIAKKYWKLNGVSDKIDLLIGDAVFTLKELIKKGYKEKFDYIFIDADKINYINYYELSLQLIRKNGIIAIDNTLFFGTVIGKQIKDEYLKKFVSEDSTNTIKELNEIISNDDRVEKCLLPIADGLTLIMKK